MWTVPQALPISDEQQRTLEAWIAARNAPQKVLFRSRAVLMAGEGKANRRIAQELDTSRPTVILWRQRFAEGGPTALTETHPAGVANPGFLPRRSNRRLANQYFSIGIATKIGKADHLIALAMMSENHQIASQCLFGRGNALTIEWSERTR